MKEAPRLTHNQTLIVGHILEELLKVLGARLVVGIDDVVPGLLFGPLREPGGLGRLLVGGGAAAGHLLLPVDAKETELVRGQIAQPVLGDVLLGDKREGELIKHHEDIHL